MAALPSSKFGMGKNHAEFAVGELPGSRHKPAAESTLEERDNQVAQCTWLSDPSGSNLRRRSSPPHSEKRLLRDRQMVLWAPELSDRRHARSRQHRRDRNPTDHSF